MALIDLKTNLAKEIKYNREDLKQSRVSNADDNYKKFKPDDDQLIKRDIGEGYRGADADGGLLRGGISFTSRTNSRRYRKNRKVINDTKRSIVTQQNKQPYKRLMETKELTFIILHQYYKVYQTIYQNKDTLKKNKVLVDSSKD